MITSAESHILGIPVALLGLAYFVVAIPFLLPAAWRLPDPRIRLVREAGAISGLGFVLWLVFAELVKIYHICEYCTSVHIITLILFVLITESTLVTAPAPAFDDDLDDPRDHDGAVAVIGPAGQRPTTEPGRRAP